MRQGVKPVITGGGRTGRNWMRQGVKSVVRGEGRTGGIG